MKPITPLAKILLTRQELWELICNFEASFDSTLPENELASNVASKLRKAFERITRE
jgi:hypothetical protein